jgi:hypothetical protein
VGETRAAWAASAAHRLVADHYAALEQQRLEVGRAEPETNVPSFRQADGRRREAGP